MVSQAVVTFHWRPKPPRCFVALNDRSLSGHSNTRFSSSIEKALYSIGTL